MSIHSTSPPHFACWQTESFLPREGRSASASRLSPEKFRRWNSRAAGVGGYVVALNVNQMEMLLSECSE